MEGNMCATHSAVELGDINNFPENSGFCRTLSMVQTRSNIINIYEYYTTQVYAAKIDGKYYVFYTYATTVNGKIDDDFVDGAVYTYTDFEMMVRDIQKFSSGDMSERTILDLKNFNFEIQL
jgi:hypothetical protein